MKHRIGIVIGTRPELIKMAPIIRAMKEDPRFQPVVICTAQHRQLLDNLWSHFEIKPDIDLNIMEPGQKPLGVAAKIVDRLENALLESKPKWVMVQGDTTTVFAASFASSYLKIPIFHVEAGMRTDDLYNPFPEEINRRLVSAIAALHFAPTQGCAENLFKEGISKDTVFITGNTVIDALLWTIAKNKKSEALPSFPHPDLNQAVIEQNYLDKAICEQNDLFNEYNALNKEISDPNDLNQTFRNSNEKNRKIILITAHRRENFGPGMEQIFTAIKTIAQHPSQPLLIYPVHPNPQVNCHAHKALEDISNIILLPPLEYPVFSQLLSISHMAITDSGGIQEEAPSLGVPVLIIREKTERPEAVDKGASILVGTCKEKIIKEAVKLLEDKEHHRKMAQIENPYGDGKSSGRILDIIANWHSTTNSQPDG